MDNGDDDLYRCTGSRQWCKAILGILDDIDSMVKDMYIHMHRIPLDDNGAFFVTVAHHSGQTDRTHTDEFSCDSTVPVRYRYELDTNKQPNYPELFPPRPENVRWHT